MLFKTRYTKKRAESQHKAVLERSSPGVSSDSQRSKRPDLDHLVKRQLAPTSPAHRKNPRTLVGPVYRRRRPSPDTVKHKGAAGYGPPRNIRYPRRRPGPLSHVPAMGPKTNLRPPSPSAGPQCLALQSITYYTSKQRDKLTHCTTCRVGTLLIPSADPAGAPGAHGFLRGGDEGADAGRARPRALTQRRTLGRPLLCALRAVIKGRNSLM
ncbi:hypothetical protein SKAU_G00084660 [Synaphobranchus kaupii]|uniref:Uncharacterized protein n=1 Tax=Synaphobranchus kaupii TaxID=118154 RepID=A0A9Q1FVD5_SYNKA|nr:hypothetical protein SKAU_G00084660 [Synaphobranchus kaupii]